MNILGMLITWFLLVVLISMVGFIVYYIYLTREIRKADSNTKMEDLTDDEIDRIVNSAFDEEGL